MFFTLVFFCLIIYLTILLIQLDDTIVSEWIRMGGTDWAPVSGFLGFREYIFCFFGIFYFIARWRAYNQSSLEPLNTMEMVKKALINEAQTHHQGAKGGRVKDISVARREGIARELALAVDKLAHECTAHPSIVCCRRSKIHRVRNSVYRLLRLLKNDDHPNSVSYACTRINMARFFAFGSREAIALVRKNSTDPHAVWSMHAKAVLLNGLQKTSGQLKRDPVHQEWIKDLILSITGPELMVLKNILDGCGDYHSMRKLIYDDITIKRIRQEIVEHFGRGHGSSVFQEGHSWMRKVLSDIDDTLYSSGGHAPAGVDKRYPKHALYPGLLRLYHELDGQYRADNLLKRLAGAGGLKAKFLPKAALARQESERMEGDDRLEFEDEPYTNLVFLSARPHIYKDWSERVSYRLFKQLLLEGRLHDMPTLVPGRAWPSIRAVLRLIRKRYDAWKEVGEVKYESILMLKHLYPNYSMVFFGDDGQGDLLAAERAQRENPPLLEVAYINKVMPDRNKVLTMFSDLSEEERQARWAELGIVFTDTPIDAAVDCCRRKLLGDNQSATQALTRIVDSARDDLQALAVSNPDFQGWGARCEEFNVSLRKAKEYCPELYVQELEADEVLEALKDLERSMIEASFGNVPTMQASPTRRNEQAEAQRLVQSADIEE